LHPLFRLFVENLFKRGEDTYGIVLDNSKEELMLVVQGKILEGSTVHTDGWSAYDGLVANE
jgi:transposase-like protein